MKNMINVRIVGVSNSKIGGSIIHNTRSQPSRNDINDNANYFYEVKADEPEPEISSSGSDATSIINVSCGSYSENLRNYYARSELSNKNRTNNQLLKKDLLKQYRKDRKVHNKLHKDRTNQNVRDYQGSWAEGIFTFSEAIKKDLGTKYTTQELEKVAFDCALDICKQMGTELKGVFLHLNESTPHFHWYFKNFDNYGHSITYKNRKTKDLSRLQDIGFKHFKALGMDRGIKKEISGATRYKTTKQYHQEQIASLNTTIGVKRDELSSTKRDLLLNIEDLQITKDKLKVVYTDLNTQKNSIKDLRYSYDRTSQEYKDLTTTFKTLQQNEKKARTKHRELISQIKDKNSQLNDISIDVANKDIWQKETKQELKKFVIDHTIKNKSNKYEIKDINHFFNEIVDLVEYVSNLDIKLQELDKVNSKLSVSNATLQIRTNKYLKYKKLYNSTKQTLNDKISRINTLSDSLYDKDTTISKTKNYTDKLEQIIKDLDGSDDVDIVNKYLEVLYEKDKSYINR